MSKDVEGRCMAPGCGALADTAADNHARARACGILGDWCNDHRYDRRGFSALHLSRLRRQQCDKRWRTVCGGEAKARPHSRWDLPATYAAPPAGVEWADLLR